MRNFAFACVGVSGLLGACTDTKTVTEEAPTPTVLTSTTTEAAGANCQYGGTHVSVGVDKNANGTLDADEVQSSFYVCDPAPATPTPNPLATVHYGTLFINSAADLAAAQSYTGVFGDIEIASPTPLAVALPNLVFATGEIYDCDDFDVAPSTISLPALQVLGDWIDFECGGVSTFSAPLLTQVSGGIYIGGQQLTSFSVPALTSVAERFEIEGTQLSSVTLLLPTDPSGYIGIDENENLDECGLLDQVAALRAKGWTGAFNSYQQGNLEIDIADNNTCEDATHRCPLVPVGGDTTSWRECYQSGLDFPNARTQCQAIGTGWDLAYLTSYADETAISALSTVESYWLGYQETDGADAASYAWLQAPASSTFLPEIGDNSFWTDGEPNYEDAPNSNCVQVFASSPTTERANAAACSESNRYLLPLCRYLAP